MKPKDHALILAADLPWGETVYDDCPVCQGKLKFSVTRSREGVLWNCFKASCPVRGFEPTLGTLVPASKSGSKLRPYRGRLVPLSEPWREFVQRRFDIDAVQLDSIRWAPEHGAFALPILDTWGYERGWVIRQPWGQEARGPKALTRMHSQGPTMSWHVPRQPLSDCAVLVEDQMSAMVCCTGGYPAAALLGTSLDNDKVREIASQQPKEVIIALDADATDQAFRLARKWGLAFKKTRVAILERDLKDEDSDDVQEILGL